MIEFGYKVTWPAAKGIDYGRREPQPGLAQPLDLSSTGLSEDPTIGAPSGNCQGTNQLRRGCGEQFLARG